jgi:hypothetical protein
MYLPQLYNYSNNPISAKVTSEYSRNFNNDNNNGNNNTRSNRDNHTLKEKKECSRSFLRVLLLDTQHNH